MRNLYVVCDAPIAHVCRVLHDGPTGPNSLTPVQSGKLAGKAAGEHCRKYPACRAEQLCVSVRLDGIESGDYMIKFKLQYTKELQEKDKHERKPREANDGISAGDS